MIVHAQIQFLHSNPITGKDYSIIKRNHLGTLSLLKFLIINCDTSLGNLSPEHIGNKILQPIDLNPG